MGPRDVVWVLGATSERVDAGTLRVDTFPLRENVSSAAVDEDGSVWIGGIPGLSRIDPRGPFVAESTSEVVFRDLQAGGGRLWGTIGPPHLASFTPATGELFEPLLPHGFTRSYEPAVDRRGRIWVATWGHPDRPGENVLQRYDPRDGSWMEVPGAAASGLQESRRTAAHLESFRKHRARWIQDVDAREPVRWNSLSWEADVPAGGSIAVLARFAASREQLGGARPCELLSPPAGLLPCPSAVRSRWARIEVAFVNGHDASPVLRAVRVTRERE